MSITLSHHDLQVLQSSLIILHFVLEGVSTAGSPANIVHEYLRGFFKDSKRLFFEEIPFDLTDEDAMEDHADTITLLSRTLAR